MYKFLQLCKGSSRLFIACGVPFAIVRCFLGLGKVTYPLQLTRTLPGKEDEGSDYQDWKPYRLPASGVEVTRRS